MIGRGRVRPSRAVSALVMLMGIGFVCFGIFFAIPGFGVFGIVWTLIAVGITIYHGINAFTGRGIATEVVDFDTDLRNEGGGESRRPLSVEERHERLESMRRRGMINDGEYGEQRERILKDL